MEIIISKLAGFCFGVNKAIDTVFSLINDQTKSIYTYGPLIHNEQVIEKLKASGVEAIDDITRLNSGDNIVIRAHGVSPDIYKKIAQMNLMLHDATCPYVKKIHNLVREKSREGYFILIIGDENHPEVIGIRGWCTEGSIVVNDEKDLEKFQGYDKKICVVSQTTLSYEKWINITKIIDNRFPNAQIFDTICSATIKRQKEAKEISKIVDIMIVVGGKNSSNTHKLFDICKANCKETFLIETWTDLPSIDINKNPKIGITAGASTPDWVIKEVFEKMSELNKLDHDFDFLQAFEKSLKGINSGEIVKGKIISSNNNEVFVDIGYKSDGIIPREEFENGVLPNPGEEIDVYVVRVNDGDGNVALSKRRVEAFKFWDTIQEAYANKTPIEAKVVEIVKGGVLAVAKGIRVFVPASQVSDRYIKDLNEIKGNTLSLRIIEFNERSRKVVGSARVLLEEDKVSKLKHVWDAIEVGKKFIGTVKHMTTFGAFIDIGGVDGLLHISEISWNRIKHPSEVVSLGDTLEVYVMEFDKVKNKVSFGHKKQEDNPWLQAINRYNVGDKVTAKIIRIVTFGVFLEIESGIEGMCHISQISEKRLLKIEDVLTVGQTVDAKILEIDTNNKKINLSIKEIRPYNPKEEIIVDDEAENIPKEHIEDPKITLGDFIEKEVKDE